MEADTHTAKTHLSRLLDQVERGEAMIITRRGKKIARLVRFEEEPAGPRPMSSAYRILLAQAKVDGLTPLTSDAQLASHGVPIIPA